MQLKSNDRVFVCAKTGAGKTTFIKTRLLPAYPKVIFWDIKRENTNFPHTFRAVNPPHLAQAIVEKHQRILYQPTDPSTEDFNKVCQIIFNAGNFLLYIDEVSYVCTGSYIEPWHKQILIMGRSRGIGIITATQRPRHVSNFCISESEHFFIGRLQMKTDVEKIAPMIPEQFQEMPYRMPYWHFLYTDTEKVILLKPC